MSDLSNFLNPGVYQGIVANGITMFLAAIGNTVKESINHKEEVRKLIASDKNITKIVTKELAKINLCLSDKAPNFKDKILFFLSSQEIETMVRRYYSSNHPNPNKKDLLAFTESNFMHSFQCFMGKNNTPDIQEIGRSIYRMMVKACDRALSIAIEQNILSAHEVTSKRRFVYLKDELEGIKRSMELFRDRPAQDVEEYLRYVEALRPLINIRNKDIKPPHFDSVKRIPIDDIYVPPAFVSGQDSSELSYKELLSTAHRVVVLGNPGCGKTTFTQKLCYDLTGQTNHILLALKKLTPLLITLREYAGAIQERSLSFIDFVAERSRVSFQLECPKNAMQYLLNEGHLLIIFDGLDELIESESRKSMCEQIESFCALYPTTPVIVTCRKIGYEKNPLDNNLFEKYYISDFDEEMVKQYVLKFFDHNEDIDQGEKEELSESFLRESGIVPDLRRNALMLSLMCNIYRGANYIPQNRPEVYKICSEMLFERWDKNRKILVRLPLDSHTKPAMMHIAFHIYNSQKLQKGVSKNTLIKQCKEYLLDRRFQDTDEAEHAAEEFIDFCKGRAWVFTDIGENIYQFTHRTFLEYFAACYLARTRETLDLSKFIIEKVLKREWDVVVQLALQIKNEATEGAADDIINALMNSASKASSTEKANIYSFCSRLLEFILPKNTNINAIVKHTLEHTINTGEVIYEATNESLIALLNPAPGNVKPISETVLSTVPSLFKSAPPARVVDIATNLGSIYSFLNKRTTSSLYNHWHSISETLFETTYDLFPRVYYHSFETCYELVKRGKIRPVDVIQKFGANAFYMKKCNAINNNISYPSYCYQVFDSLVNGDFDSHNDTLRVLGVVLSRKPVDKNVIIIDSEFGALFSNVLAQHDVIMSGINRDSRWGFFAVVASIIEAIHAWDQHFFNDVTDHFKKAYIYKGRYYPSDSRQVVKQLGSLSFQSGEVEELLRWVQGQINFTSRDLEGW